MIAVNGNLFPGGDDPSLITTGLTRTILLFPTSQIPIFGNSSSKPESLRKWIRVIQHKLGKSRDICAAVDHRDYSGNYIQTASNQRLGYHRTREPGPDDALGHKWFAQTQLAPGKAQRSFRTGSVDHRKTGRSYPTRAR